MNDSDTRPTAAKPATPKPGPSAPPPETTAALVLADGAVFWGQGLGASRQAVGEVCFNTSMTGYQEILTDPSYAGQIITFTFPHIGNVGTNPEDIETTTPAARGLVLRAAITEPANWRATRHLDAWLTAHDLPGIAGVDTRALTRRIRDLGAPHGSLIHAPDGRFDLAALRRQSAEWPGLEGMDLAKEVSCTQSYVWEETGWQLGEGYGRLASSRFHVVAVDFGAKRNILRCLATLGCKVTVVPAATPAEEILAQDPDGVFLSNGPGDPAATGRYAVPMIRALLERPETIRSRTWRPAKSRSPARTMASWSRRRACRPASRRAMSACSTAATRGCGSAAGRCSRFSITRRLRPGRRTATTSSRASSR
jgi:carbamoyl-phosphate synthase small subunit